MMPSVNQIAEKAEKSLLTFIEHELKYMRYLQVSM